MTRFIAQLLDRGHGRLFLKAFMPLARRVAEAGVDHGLVQLALKLTCPGVPDIYQGGELWDLNLVDPDNRRAVDFARRARVLETLKSWETGAADQRLVQLRAWREHWHDGTIKMHVLHRLLQLRGAHPDLFLYGDYRPLELSPELADDAIAFERTHADERLVVVALLHGSDQADALTAELARVLVAQADADFTEVLTGARCGGEEGVVASALRLLPVQVWLHAADSALS